jgi:hypothetical protein
MSNNSAGRAYDPEPLIEAVTSLDWHENNPGHALDAIKAKIRDVEGTIVSDSDAVNLLNGLVDRKLICPRKDPPAANLAETGQRAECRRVKYFRVPQQP